jgi:dihydroorotase-like cyclic amidohydrolase
MILGISALPWIFATTFKGRRLQGRVMRTFVGGKTVFER